MYVGINWEGRMTECLRHHHTGGLVADTGERFEKLPIIGDLPTRFKNLLGHPTKILGLGRGRPISRMRLRISSGSRSAIFWGVFGK